MSKCYESDEIEEKVLTRLKEILEESGMIQVKFGYEILGNRGENHAGFTNDIFKGRKKLSEKKAKNIIQKYPQYRLEWILGKDDYKTEQEKSFAELKEIMSESKMKLLAFQTLAQLLGYYIYLTDNPTNDVGEMVEAVKRGYTIQYKGKEVGRIPIDRFNLLAQDILELTELRIKSFLREQEG